MDFYFVYSSGGGAGDWNGVNRMWNEFMPNYFKENTLIKFGDIFFNHKGLNSLLKKSNWSKIYNAREWIVDRTNDNSLYNTKNLIMDVGTTKIVNYIDSKFPNLSTNEIIEKFDSIIDSEKILERYCKFILDSNIHNAVTFDIPNPFKVRNQSGNPIRNIFNDKKCKSLLIDKCVKYANFTYHNIDDESRLLTILPAFLQDDEINQYLSRLDYKSTKLAIGALIDMNNEEFVNSILNIDKILNLKSFKKVHFLGCGGLSKAKLIKATLGNHSNFSVDNTTAFNRSIDGSKNGNSSLKEDQSCYIDYLNKKQFRIKPQSKEEILKIHFATPNELKLFSNQEMIVIINSILEHQSDNSSKETYDNRAKLIMHNFDVFRYNAE
ncbi:hypothetical protein [Flavobacterium solisilvae]|uniref:Uncharacterized protein n=1 Tax=Flavobacterium solisilvae TaxID=1852019 RepID=A0ABX1QRL3_9FLAO|nr:hypothetical protein [Flavobacterium solisilvae]NMH24921.1 hypothetical protein [Flavobacterium solisilvae]